MSISGDRDALARLNREIATLRGKEADEMKKEGDALRRMNAANGQAAEASSTSSRSSYLGTATREQKSMEDAQKRRSQYASTIASKSSDAGRLEEKISKGEAAERKKSATEAEKARKLDEAERKKLAKANESLRRDYEAVQRTQQKRIVELEQRITQQSTSGPKPSVGPGQIEVQDFFVSHAHADKADFVDGLVKAAREAGLKVWYDRFELDWGSSVRQKIDEGLAGAFFGVVVLSPNFFNRPWPEYELDGLLQKDLSGEGRLLPIWHRLTQDDVKRHAPSLAGRMALSTSQYDTAAIVEQLLQMRDKIRNSAAEVS